ncbi:hypothetical protein DPMN_076698 [Dreissena polymorpha]|uniref:Uncharacterized protein n=1 Tax=Dreissena polymorpha TaxID=45954 RepID=A0A9D3YKK6_DREPO|nr:hypothetical protein DPMN_076698 [Dreissena polymorpha]
MAKWSTGRTLSIEERTSKWEVALSKHPQIPLERKATDSLLLIAIFITLDSTKHLPNLFLEYSKFVLPETSSLIAAR